MFDCILPICEVTSKVSCATNDIGCYAKFFPFFQFKEFIEDTSNIDEWTKDIDSRANDGPSNVGDGRHDGCRWYRLEAENVNGKTGWHDMVAKCNYSCTYMSTHLYSICTKSSLPRKI